MILGEIASREAFVEIRKSLILFAGLGLASCGGVEENPRVDLRPKNELRVIAKPASEGDAAWRQEASAALGPILQAIGESDLQIDETVAVPSIPALGITEDYLISLPNTSLGQEFLLQGSLISQTTVPSFTGMKSRIVYFERRGNTLLMLESNKGHLVSEALPQELLLASFNIIEDKGDNIIFDFNAGMSNVFFVEDWYAQDAYGADRYWAGDFVSLPTRNRFIRAAGLSEKSNALEIDQVAQLNVDQMGATASDVVRVKYYLRPYVQNPDFKPTSSHIDDFNDRGFFEVTPTLTLDDQIRTYASKFDHRRPISFAVSANTPEAYRDAVKEGVLYWNKAFGSEIVQVTDAPKGISAPSIDYNMVQWVDWDSAGMAYADAQMDPLTGEILNAQVFMTSVFAFGGKARAMQLLKFLESRADESNAVPTRRVGVKGLSDHGVGQMCGQEFSAKAIRQLRQALNSGASDEQLLRISQDYVRHVVAHEIGHTLGLRHNFAGSLATNFPLSEREEIVQNYISEAQVDESVVVTSSVMDYLEFQESVISGHQIKHEASASTYDLQAIRYLYYGEETPTNQRALFCTDTHRARFADCQIWDTGSSALEYAAWQMQELRDQLPQEIFWTFVNEKAPGFGMRSRSPGQVYFNPEAIAKQAVSSWLVPMYDMFSEDSPKLLSVRRRYPVLSPLNEKKVAAAEQEQILADAQRLGGLATLMPPVTAEEVEAMYADFVSLLDQPGALEGMAASGETYSFSSGERRAMEAIAREIFDQLRDEFALADIRSFINGYPPKVWDEPATEAFFQMLAERLEDYVFSEDRSKRAEIYEIQVSVDGVDNKSEQGPPAEDSTEEDSTEVVSLTVSLPNFVYSYETRLMAAELFRELRATSPEWCDGCEVKFKDQYREFLKEIFGGYDPTKLEPAELPRSLRKWIRENNDILIELPNKSYGVSKN